jgi:hypothetical protein
MEAAHKDNRALVENEAEAIIAEADAEVFPLCVKRFEVWNLAKGSGCFDLFNHFPDSSQKPGIGDNGQIPVK